MKVVGRVREWGRWRIRTGGVHVGLGYAVACSLNEKLGEELVRRVWGERLVRLDKEGRKDGGEQAGLTGVLS